MRNVLAIARREIIAYFASPIAYVVLAAFLGVIGYFFPLILFYSQQATLEYVLSDMAFVLLLITPLLTMRLLAEEQRLGTIELLLTSPVRDWELVAGKFLASLAFLTILLVLSAYTSLILFQVGNPDPGPILTGYLGIFLLGGSLLAIGLLLSSLTQNQIVAAVLSLVIMILLWLLSALAGALEPPVSDVLLSMAIFEHFSDFVKGIISLKDVVFYLSLMALTLFLTTRSVETRRWR